RIKAFSLIALLTLICAGWMVARAADQPLTKDDVRVLLIGGASGEKMITLIQGRGVDFQMTPDLAKKFHDDGASDEVIEALQKSGQKAASVKASSPAKPEASSANVAAPPPAGSNPPRSEEHTSELQSLRHLVC